MSTEACGGPAPQAGSPPECSRTTAEVLQSELSDKIPPQQNSVEAFSDDADCDDQGDEAAEKEGEELTSLQAAGEDDSTRTGQQASSVSKVDQPAFSDRRALADCAGQEFEKICRICHSCDEDEELISPCLCKGSGRWVHRKCLQQWRVKSSRSDSYHTCELCQYQYTVTCAGWARALCHDVVQIALTAVLLLFAISAGAVVWELLARLFVTLCDESDDSFRFAIQVMGQDIGFLFGGVIMAKIGVIILQIFKHDTPEVQNMVGFLAFIVFLVQSRVFAPVHAEPTTGGSGGGAEKAEASDDVSEAGILLIQKYAPHYFLAVYTATTFRWCFSVVSRVSVWAQRTATTVECLRGHERMRDAVTVTG